MQYQRFRVIFSLLMLAVAGLTGLAWLALPREAGAQQSTEKPELEMPEGGDPMLLLTGVKATISREGQLRQQVGAQQARLTLTMGPDKSLEHFEESKKVLDMVDLHMRFFENGELFASGDAGEGRLWLDDQPEQNAHRNDAVLEGHVDFEILGDMRFQTDQIKYSQKDVRLWSERPVKMYKRGANGSDILSQGTGFIVELIPGTNNVKTFQLYGDESARGSIKAVPAEKMETHP